MSPTTIPGNFVLQSPAANDPLLDLNTQPSLDLQFATSKTLDDRVSGQNLITFSRSTTGTYVDSNGIIQTAAIDAPRFDHDPTTNASLGLLVEESRTNEIPYSEDFTTWGLFDTGDTLTSSALTSPDGTLTGTLFAPDNTSGLHIVRQSYTFQGGTTYTLSVFVKEGGRRYMQLAVGGSSLGFPSYDYRRGVFDLQTGSVNSTPLNGSADIKPFANGWYRCSMTITPPSGGAANFDLYHADTTTPTINTVADGNGTDGIYIWGAQLEEGAFATSYIPTSGSTVPRAADVASITGSNFSRWYNQSEGSFVADFNANGRTGAGRIVGTNAGATPMYLAADTIIRSFGTVVGASVTVPSVFSTQKAAIGYEVSSQQDTLVVDGGAPNTSINSGNFAGFAATTTTSIQLFSYPSATSHTSGTIARLTYYPYRLPDATLQEITS